MELPRGARRCEKTDSIGGEWGFLRRSFVREWERFAKKVGTWVRLPLRGQSILRLRRPFFKGLLHWHVKVQRPSATHFLMGMSMK